MLKNNNNNNNKISMQIGNSQIINQIQKIPNVGINNGQQKKVRKIFSKIRNFAKNVKRKVIRKKLKETKMIFAFNREINERKIYHFPCGLRAVCSKVLHVAGEPLVKPQIIPPGTCHDVTKPLQTTINQSFIFFLA